MCSLPGNDCFSSSTQECCSALCLLATTFLFMSGLKKEDSKAKSGPQIMMLGLRFGPRFYHTYSTCLRGWADKQERYYNVLHSLLSFCFSSPHTYSLHLHAIQNQVYNNETTSKYDLFNFLYHVNTITNSPIKVTVFSEISCKKNLCTLLQKVLPDQCTAKPAT